MNNRPAGVVQPIPPIRGDRWTMLDVTGTVLDSEIFFWTMAGRAGQKLDGRRQRLDASWTMARCGMDLPVQRLSGRPERDVGARSKVHIILYVYHIGANR